MARRLLILLALCVLASCTPAAQRAPGGPAVDRPAAPTAAPPSRTLVMLIRSEPTSLLGTQIINTITTGTQRRLFNAALTLLDGDDQPQPYLAEALPRLNTDTWRMLPDGRMETIYRLKPGLFWHDGTPLTADAFVLAWRMYTAPELGIAGGLPQSYMEEVTAPDERTVLIRWRRPFPEAGTLTGSNGSDRTTDFTPLPPHRLGQLNPQEREAFLAHPYWTTDYVGLGPYRLDRWEPGAYVEAVAFDRHVLGRPRIDRVKLIWNADANAALAALVARAAHLPADDPLRFQQGQILKREWEPRQAGTVRYRPTFWRFTQFQFKPEYANPRATLDRRVRQALNHAVDKEALNGALFEGEGLLADTLIYSGASYFPALDREIAKYPYDLRRAEQLMEEAGYRKGADGFFGSPAEGRLEFELKVIQSAQSDAERTIMAAGYRSAGFSFEEAAFAPAQAGDQQALATFRSLLTTSGPGGETALINYTTGNIMRAETRWQGRNRGGWSNEEYDRLVDAFQTTLDRDQRTQQLIQALRILSQEVGVMSLYFKLAVLAYPTELKGINIRSGEGEMSWNIHQWELG